VKDSTAPPKSAQWGLYSWTTWPLLVLLALLLLAFALRVYRLPAQSLWYDEGVSWYLTRMSLPALTVWTANDIQPPLYYYLLWLWVRLAGTSEYALRFPSVFFGLLTLPLLWITARRLLGKRAAWLAALFLALSPLHVYYAQEARMYTLLTFLGLLSSYLLLRLLNNQSTTLQSPYLWSYILAVVAALYTHYFAFFLLAAHVLYVLYKWGQQVRSGHVLNSHVSTSTSTSTLALISISILLLYLPWLPFLLTRYGLDTSYWPGTLKLGEVARKLFIAFGLGETVKEQVGTQLALGYGLILLISLLALLRRTRPAQYATVRSLPVGRNTQYAVRPAPTDSLVFLLLYLLVPIALVLLSVYRTPKFNPRYAMLASPAFILLIAGGLSSLISHHAPRTTHHTPRSPEGDLMVTSYVSRFTFHVSRFTFPRRGPIGYASRFIFSVALIYILSTSAYSLRNWFAPYPVNQFNKADFRITAQIVRDRIRPDETVVLSSGHMFPAWAYYYGWSGWQRLPGIEILDVNAALDLSVGDELDHLLQGKRGVWLVRWQNQVTDPFDVLPLYLGTVGAQDDYGQFWYMELFHYNLPPDARFDLAGFITQRADADFGDQVRLLGMRRISSTELVLIWQALASMETDYTLFVHVLDADGQILVNADHLPPRPTREWRPGQIVPDRVTLALLPDLPPGDYRIEVGLYDAGDPALTRLPLDDGSGDRATLPLHLEADDLD
jgi:mannosyltransferase